MLSQDRSGGRVWAGRMGSRGWLAGAALAVIAILGGGPVLAAGPPNDAFGAARPIALTEHVELETGGATLQDREPRPACNRGAGASVWFTFTPKEDGRYAADTFESGYDTVVAVYKGGWLGGLKPLACSDDAGGPTSYAIFNARAGIPYRIQVTGDRARTGSLDLVLGYAPDVTGPRIRGPVSTLVTGVPMGRATVTRWSARDKQSGVARYEVQVSRDGGRFEPITLDPETARSVAGPLLRGRRVQVRVRAWNHQLMPSTWSVGPAFIPRVIQEDSPDVTTKGAWVQRAAASASGGSTLWSVQPGARATVRVTARTVAIVAPRGPRRGEATILLDGTAVATVDLGAAERQPRTVVFARSFPDVGQHTVTIEVVGTPGRARVDLDAVVIHAAAR